MKTIGCRQIRELKVAWLVYMLAQPLQLDK